MKKFILVTIAALVCSFSMIAQESNRDENGKIQYGPYETNRFFDNVFVGVGGGANLGLDNISTFDAKKFDYGWGLDAEAYVGKVITPNAIVRLGWQGHNVSWGGNKWVWPKKDGAVGFNFVHGDFMWNVSNQFGGYKETRAINIVPYLTAGVLWNKGDRSLGVGAGVEFPVRVSNRVAIVPDLRIVGTQATFLHPGTTGIANYATAAVSVRVTLGKTNFKRVSTTAKEYAAVIAGRDATITELVVKNDALGKKNTVLANEVNETNALVAKLVKELKAREEADGTFDYLDVDSYAVFFEIDEDTLSEKELAHFEHFVRNVLASNNTVTLTLFGSADTATGTLTYNKLLADKRADFVKGLLVEYFGINPDRVEVLERVLDCKDSAELSRAVVISHK